MPALDPITAFTNAVEQRLRTWFEKKTWEWHIVPRQLTLEEFKQISTKTPLLAWAWTKITPAANAGRQFTGEAEFTLTLVTKNPTKGKARYLGDSQGAGLFPSVALAIAVLHGWTVKDHGTLLVTAVDQTYADGHNDHALSMASIDLRATIAFGDFLQAVEASPEFLSLRTAWDADQAEDEPTDTIELPQGAEPSGEPS